MQRERTRRHLLTTIAVAFVLLAAAACSTGSDAEGPDTSADPGVETTNPDSPDDPTTTDDPQTGDEGNEVPRWGDEAEMACIDEHPNDVDLDDLEEQDEPTPAELLPAIEAILDCIDDPASSPGVRAIVSATLEGGSRGLKVSPGEAGCIVDEVIDNADDPALVLAGGGGESDSKAMDDALSGCLTEENLDVISGSTEDGPQERGDDPRLDAIWDDCDAGDMRACDLLFFHAPTGSAYEEQAETCGGTDPDVSTFCSEDTDVDDDWILHSDSAAALRLVADCEAGDFTACDLLFQIAPVDSDLENWGNTCAERVNSPAIPDCRTLFG